MNQHQTFPNVNISIKIIYQKKQRKYNKSHENHKDKYIIPLYN